MHPRPPRQSIPSRTRSVFATIPNQVQSRSPVKNLLVCGRALTRAPARTGLRTLGTSASKRRGTVCHLRLQTSFHPSSSLDHAQKSSGAVATIVPRWSRSPTRPGGPLITTSSYPQAHASSLSCSAVMGTLSRTQSRNHHHLLIAPNKFEPICICPSTRAYADPGPHRPPVTIIDAASQPESQI